MSNGHAVFKLDHLASVTTALVSDRKETQTAWSEIAAAVLESRSILARVHSSRMVSYFLSVHNNMI